MDKEFCKYIVARRPDAFWLIVYEKDPNYEIPLPVDLRSPRGWIEIKWRKMTLQRTPAESTTMGLVSFTCNLQDVYAEE
jgi:hypothetical protein